MSALLPPPPIEERASWVQVSGGDPEMLEVPRKAPTAYLTHGLFRYVGKLPPPLVSFVLSEYTSPGDVVVDPMAGGGTTAIEAVSSGRTALSFDINPVALIISESLSNPANIDRLLTFAAAVSSDAVPASPPEALAGYFSDEAYGLIRHGLDTAPGPVETSLILSIVRRASNANTKKINTVVDPSKQPKSARGLLEEWARKFATAFGQLNEVSTATSTVTEGKATAVPLEDESADFVMLHPPYITNTAFSEVTQLQLTLLGRQHKDLRTQELAYRGSYFHVPNGLKKYLLGWATILSEAARVLKPGGTAVVVVGDGYIDKVRIPVGTITEEFAQDLDLKPERRAWHVLNNQTGWTLSRRMTGQHVLIFRKS